MTAGEKIAALEARLERVESLVCHCQQVKGILAGEQAASQRAARVAHLHRFASAASPEERLAIFAASTDAEQANLISNNSPERWAGILAGTPPEQRHVYLAAMRRTPAGSSLVRFVAFEVAPPPDVIEVQLTAERSVSTDIMPGHELRRGLPLRMYRKRWAEEFEGSMYGSRIAAMQAAGDIAVTAVEPQVARSYARADVDAQVPDICRAG